MQKRMPHEIILSFLLFLTTTAAQTITPCAAGNYGTFVSGDVCRNATWTTQDADLPEFEWVVLDHGSAGTFGYAGAVSKDFTFAAGFALGDLKVTNVATGESIASLGLGRGGNAATSFLTVYDMFIVKTDLNGTPLGMWTYEGNDFDLVTDLKANDDHDLLAVAGLFSGNLTLGAFVLSSQAEADPFFGVAGERFVALLSATTGEVFWARKFPPPRRVPPPGLTLGSVAFDDDGNLFIDGVSCGGVDGQCAMLLSKDDGSTLWQFDPTGTGILFNDDLYGATAYLNGYFYLTASLRGQVDGLFPITVQSSSIEYADAFLVVLDAIDGTPTWAATVQGPATSNFVTVRICASAD